MSLSIFDDLVFCDICAANGFPHEPIRFVDVGLLEDDVLPFDFIVGKVRRRRKYFAYNYFEGGRHHHKNKKLRSVMEEAA